MSWSRDPNIRALQRLEAMGMELAGQLLGTTEVERRRACSQLPAQKCWETLCDNTGGQSYYEHRSTSMAWSREGAATAGNQGWSWQGHHMA